MTRRALGVVLVVAGLLALADAGLTVAWKEPLTALRERSAQRELRRELRAVRLPSPSVPVRTGASTPTLASVAGHAARARRDGRALGELRIPRIGVDVVALTSARPEDLRRGPGLVAPSTVARARAHHGAGRPPHDLRGAVPPRRRPAPRRRDRARHALRDVPLRRRDPADRRSFPTSASCRTADATASCSPPVTPSTRPPGASSWWPGSPESNGRPPNSRRALPMPDRERGSRAVRGWRTDQTMTETLAHSMKISSLKRRIERAEYSVDPDAVATAFVRHLLARRTDAGGFGITRDGARTHADDGDFPPR